VNKKTSVVFGHRWNVSEFANSVFASEKPSIWRLKSLRAEWLQATHE